MPTNLSIKNVPDDIMEQVRKQAKRHHRSIQDEILAILKEATITSGLTIDQAEVRIKALNFKTGDDSSTWLRELRDARY